MAVNPRRRIPSTLPSGALNAWALLSAVTLAECRTLRRLYRFKVFVTLLVSTLLVAYVYYSYVHSMLLSPLAAVALPRFTTPYLSAYVVWLLALGVIFFGFDSRQRDFSDNIAEVLDTRATSSALVIAGRLFALVGTTVAALLIALVGIQIAALVGKLTDLPIHAVEPVSTTLFVLFDAVPALAFWGSLVLCLGILTRNRLAAFLLASTVLSLHVWSYNQIPAHLLSSLSLVHIHDNWSSDLAPRLPDVWAVIQRLSMLAIAAAMVTYAAPDHRNDRIQRRALFVVSALLGSLGLAGLCGLAAKEMAETRRGQALHRAHATVTAVPPTVREITGHLDLIPGKELGLDVRMLLEVDPNRDPAKLVFRLNPGLRVKNATLNERRVDFIHEHGLLVVAPDDSVRPTGSAYALRVRASGRPDVDFGYLDSATNWRGQRARSQLLWFGTQSGVFHADYVALMPTIGWLPLPAPPTGTDQLPSHFPSIDMTVRVPDDWIAAGPGRRQLDVGHYRFRPSVPLPEVGLFAGPFARRSAVISGVEVELLMLPTHLRNLGHLGIRADVIGTELERLLDDARDAGVPYQHASLTFVEVPSYLRTYGGGSTMPSVMSLPGVVMLREQGVPYLNYRNLDLAGPRGAAPLLHAVSHPSSSDSILRGLTRNMAGFDAVPDNIALRRIQDALALAYFAEEEWRPFVEDHLIGFSARSHTGESAFGATFLEMWHGLTRRLPLVLHLRDFERAPAAVWQTLEEKSLWELSQADDVTGVAAFGRRSAAVARSVFDVFGRDRVGTLLSILRNRFGGRTYGTADFSRAASDAGIDLNAALGDWIGSRELPAFTVTRAEVIDLSERGDGDTGYQATAHVRNDAGTPGVVRLVAQWYGAGPHSAPVVVPANSSVDVSFRSADYPSQLWLYPYLSLNRLPVYISSEHERTRASAPHKPPGHIVRPRMNSPSTGGQDSFVIDDLDAGFLVHQVDATSRPLLADLALGDRDLSTPVQGQGRWRRVALPSSWGVYRHTAVGALAAESGGEVAVFSTAIPVRGLWALDYHVPAKRLGGVGRLGGSSTQLFGQLGTVNMRVVTASGVSRVEFDGADAAPGWNAIGRFQLSRTNVRVEVTTRTDGDLVLADAVRWRLVES